jgi:AraC-like DNA-binding protein
VKISNLRSRIGKGFTHGIKKQGAFYRKSLIWLLLTASIPGFITGVCIYLFGVDRVEQDLSKLHQNQMEERVKNIDDQLSYLEMDLSHWAFSPRFGHSLSELDFVYYFKETRDISTSLIVMQGSHPLIQDVELYVDRSDPVVFRTGYYRVTIPEEVERYRALLADKRSMYWMEDPMRLVHKIPGDSTTPFGYLIVTMNRDKVVNLLKTMTPYNKGLTFLMRADGEVLVADNKESEQTEALRAAITNRSEERSGTFLWEWKGVNYSVSFGQLRRIETEWTYVSAVPTSVITSPVAVLSNIILIVSTAALLLALLLSWLTSIGMYSPVERLLRRLDDQLPSLRTSFLLQLLQGHLYSYSEEDLLERMKSYGWETNNRFIYVIHFQLTGYGLRSDRFPPGNEGLLTFAASNIIEELTAEQFDQIGIINFHDLTIGLLLMTSDATSVKATLLQLGDEITQKVNRILGLQVTMTISQPTDSVKRIASTFMEVKRAAGFRTFEDRNQILDMEKLSTSENEETNYPFELEMEIIQALRSGKQSVAEELISKFLHEVFTRHGTEIRVQQSMLQLLGSIQHMILQSGVSTYRLFGGLNLFDQLSQIREPVKMLRFLKERVIGPYMLEREARADGELKLLIEQTVIYMHANYMKDISLESCSDRVQLNSYTLSKLFKQTTGVNFIDYLTDLRIGKAKQLLLATDRKINDIAEEVGYQQRYFNRIFKKQVGITPGQFRELS